MIKKIELDKIEKRILIRFSETVYLYIIISVLLSNENVLTFTSSGYSTLTCVYLVWFRGTIARDVQTRQPRKE